MMVESSWDTSDHEITSHGVSAASLRREYVVPAIEAVMAGRLSRAIGPELRVILAVCQTQRRLALPHGCRRQLCRFQWITYARIDDELLKIVAVENTSKNSAARVVVERGFDGTTPAAHVGAPVLAPLYNQLPAIESDGGGISATLSYGLMAATDFASEFLVNATKTALAAGTAEAGTTALAPASYGMNEDLLNRENIKRATKSRASSPHALTL